MRRVITVLTCQHDNVELLLHSVSDHVKRRLLTRQEEMYINQNTFNGNSSDGISLRPVQDSGQNINI